MKQADSQEQFSVKIWAETIECFLLYKREYLEGLKFPLVVLIQTCAPFF
jgi:hypothetical protein